MTDLTILCGDALEQLKTLPDECVQCCVTSPPYWGLRDYGIAGQLGEEKTPEEYTAALVAIFREVRRVLKIDGTVFLNLGDSYCGGGNGGNPSHSPYQKQKTNRGSFSDYDETRPNRSRSDVLACDSDGKALPNLTASDCACSCLCDGCQDALGFGRSENICQLHGQSVSPISQKAHDSGRSGSCASPPGVLLPVAQASTTPQSSPPLPVGCCHCSNCGVCLSVLRSSRRDARLCVRNSCLNNAKVQPQVKLKPKDLVGIPWRAAFALQADGWWLRSDIIWAKPNPMPESVTDRPTRAHEYIFLLSKTQKYFYDHEAVKEEAEYRDDARPFGGAGGNRHGDEETVYDPRVSWKGSEFHTGKTGEHQLGRSSKKRGEFNGKTNALEGREAFRAFVMTRNKRSVWTVPSSPYKEAHFATYPPALIKPCILAGSKPGDTILDPFGGSGTTGMVSLELGRKAILCELNPEYVKLIERRCDVTRGLAI